jgi:hypothetical protein
MRWFCTGHFAATWLVCTSLLLRFQRADNGSVAMVVFGIILWPLLLWALPLKGYFHLKSITLDRLKARVQHGDLRKAVVFVFGFCTSLLAAACIGLAAWGVGAIDGWFRQKDGMMGFVHTLAWFPVAFALWVILPKVVLSMLARGGNLSEPAGPPAPAERPKPAMIR